MKLDELLNEVTFKRGTLIHVNGFPFLLQDDTTVLGRVENVELDEEVKRMTIPK